MFEEETTREQREGFEAYLRKWKLENPIEVGTFVEYWSKNPMENHPNKTGYVEKIKRTPDGEPRFYVNGAWRGSCMYVPTPEQIIEAREQLPRRKKLAEEMERCRP